MSRVGTKIPDVMFAIRVRDDSIAGPNPYKWDYKETDDFFKGKRVILFSLPGAFTPTCSTYQLPGFESKYNEFKALGIDEIYCMSVNDAFVMNAWMKQQCVERVKALPDGNGVFTSEIGMDVQKYNVGFGIRSWRYAAIINDCTIEAWFEEPGKKENAEDDPYGKTSPEEVLSWLKANQVEKERG